MKNQYVVFYSYYGSREIMHYSFDVEIQPSAALTMNEIYLAIKNYVGANRFTIVSINKLN